MVFNLHFGLYLYVLNRNDLQSYLVASPSTQSSYITSAENLTQFIIPSNQKGHQEEDVKGETIVSVYPLWWM